MKSGSAPRSLSFSVGPYRRRASPKRSGMWPAQTPYQPTIADLHKNGRKFPPNYLHDSWLDYLYWDTELEP